MKKISYAKAINSAIHESMLIDDGVICYGLGVTDPKGVFGTTLNLENKFGKDRVFDIPASENAITGISIGAGLNKIKSIVTHQRLDFFLLAMDQLVNGAAKWHYMFGGQLSVPITIRLIIGRGWGQGPTHSQNLQAWFAHIPGLKVVMPSTPKDAKGLLMSSIFDPNPVIFLEHRWLHNAIGDVPEGDYRDQIGKASIITSGKDLTIVSMSYLTIESIKAIKYLKKFNINCELIDLKTIKPIDWNTIKKSLKKTGRLLVLDTGYTTGSVAGEIIAKLSIENFSYFKDAPERIAMPDVPEPTSFYLTKNFYTDSNVIAKKVVSMLNCKSSILDALENDTNLHDVPGDWFEGPF
tara:strand:- start:24974 stop:26029 length:1056 start_codon:yes stop_codon:yes gene_type:complete